MLIETTRFGPVEIDEQRIITFTEGILGFAQQRQFALIQTSEDPVFYWLQSIDNPALAFIVCDPRTFVPEYEVPIRADDMRTLELDGLADCQVFSIVNSVDGYLTANLLGPLVVGATSLKAKQFVLADKRYSTRQRLMRADAVTNVSRSA